MNLSLSFLTWLHIQCLMRMYQLSTKRVEVLSTRKIIFYNRDDVMIHIRMSPWGRSHLFLNVSLFNKWKNTFLQLTEVAHYVDMSQAQIFLDITHPRSTKVKRIPCQSWQNPKNNLIKSGLNYFNYRSKLKRHKLSRAFQVKIPLKLSQQRHSLNKSNESQNNRVHCRSMKTRS